ncbi:thioredoxin family protein [Zunongwangia profunda]|jgi:hypothetical protein|uniref:thioredoxin family protein n=1 Tax=Zunongwangia profunda TaxID=398743 RepID=UPI001D1900B9|nr:thioredoxin family protein [Zunongwangia profunda]MCC4227143.1 thioredoxin family protein [Zunongwangia profunda]|tara:strand:+ start:559 stop:804 length:246 start_codon:yes stop_codon:yes gene_type:complete
MNTEIKILHSSCCAKGSPIKEQLEKLAKENNLSITIEELSEMQDTMVYGTMSFPSLVVNNQVYDFKKLKSDADILSIIKSA